MFEGGPPARDEHLSILCRSIPLGSRWLAWRAGLFPQFLG